MHCSSFSNINSAVCGAGITTTCLFACLLCIDCVYCICPWSKYTVFDFYPARDVVVNINTHALNAIHTRYCGQLCVYFMQLIRRNTCSLIRLFFVVSFILSFFWLPQSNDHIKASTHTYTNVWFSLSLFLSLDASLFGCVSARIRFCILHLYFSLFHIIRCVVFLCRCSLSHLRLLYQNMLCVRRPQLINKHCAVAYTHRPNIPASTPLRCTLKIRPSQFSWMFRWVHTHNNKQQTSNPEQ